MSADAVGRRITFGVQANVPLGALAVVARSAESIGVERLLVADHPGLMADPFVALATAASATDRIQVGTYVLNAGVREPWQVAEAVLSLEALAPGRLVLGLGAGHTPSEWLLAGLEQPSPGGRVDRLEEFVGLLSQLLQVDAVSHRGEYFRCERAALDSPPPSVPLLIGGNGRRVLTLAGRHAQVISISGLGVTLADGHSHAVKWSERDVADSIELINAAVQSAGTRPELEVLVQHLELCADREAAAAEALPADTVPGLDLETALNTPFLLFGTPEEIADQLRRWRDDHGITRFVVRHGVLDQLPQVLSQLP